jgi:uroporphyrin-III C-methyltransferase / precorrin-2 dehydrogenase / sirohydrochlorin ferrochelatase
MSLLPIFVNLENRRVLLVGAGNVALEKIGSLLKTGLRLRVVAPRVLPEVHRLASEGKLELTERAFEPEDLDGSFLVITATDSPEVNHAVYREAVARNILCNSVDDIPNCDFFFGSLVSRGDLQIAISTAGESPALAQRLRREIDEQLPHDIGQWLAKIGELRREVLETHPRGEERRLLLHELAQRQICDSALCETRRLATYGRESERAVAGTAYLVGGGPGDPDLLTVRAVRLIESADVVLHDDLVPQAILDLASASAEIENVGKRCGVKNITQEEINALMVEHARAGRSVVRLKSGDPLLFGRAAEEINALHEAGIPYVVVPGVSAALEDATRVVYMPGRDLTLLAEEWMAEGLPADLPCAVVSRAAQPEQEVIHTTLGALRHAPPAAAPSLLIAGWAVHHASLSADVDSIAELNSRR